MEAEPQKTPLERAVDHMGSAAALARALNVTPMAVSQWRRRGIPLYRAADIEAVTGGVVTRGDISPDFFGVE